ncbi:ABC transporter permease [Acidobacteria bacterium AB60]|nr:ABC transporter permease [Acidobacteria bacterium AB60]
MHSLRQDLVYALRQMRQSPIFTLTALLTLALGIGATTAIFSLIHSVMLKSLPVADPAALYRVGEGNDCCVNMGPEGSWGLFPYLVYQRFQAAAPEFEEMAAFQAARNLYSVRLSQSDAQAKPLLAEYVSGNYFSTFGLKAQVGRTLAPSDDQRGAPPAAMLTHRAWQQLYGADSSIIGSTLLIDGHPFTIVGIAPRGFSSETLESDPPELFLPIQQEPLIAGPNTILNQPMSWLRIIGRLRPGINPESLNPRFTTILRSWFLHDFGPLFPQFAPQVNAVLPKQFVRLTPGGAGIGVMKSDYQASLHILLAVCGLVLLIACANIANLLLARGSARNTQTAIRLALGASRARLVRQWITESLVLAVAGGLAGLVVAFAGVKLILALAFRHAHYVPISALPSLPVLAFAFGVALLTGLLFGTIPAWIGSGGNPAAALHGANRSTSDRSSLWQKSLIVFQATLSVVLLAGAGMLSRSLQKMQNQDFGFETDQRVSIRLYAPFSGYSRLKLDATYRALRQRLERIPGVKSAALALYTPFTNNWGELVFRPGSQPPNISDPGSVMVSWDRVSAGYLETMGQTLVRGRTITEQDTAASRNIAVVDEAFVKRYFKPEEEPIGAVFGIDDPRYAKTYEIVGVLHTANYTDPSGRWRPPLFFVPLAQAATYDKQMIQMIDDRSHIIDAAVLQVQGSMEGLEAQVKQAFSEVDPNLTLVTIRPMAQQVADRLDQDRTVAQLTGLFGFLALILAGVGLYGVTAYTVERRTREIGVRIAMGANRATVMELVLKGAFLQIVIGLLLGIPASIGCARLIASKLYHVNAWDPVALSAAVLALAACALVASLVPARKAAAVNPVTALRVE